MKENTMSTNNPTRVITNEVRLCYADIFEAKSIQGGKPKYSVSLIIPKDDTDTLAKIERAIDAVIDAGLGKFGGKRPNKAALKLLLRGGDIERDDDAYANAMFVNANSTTPPQVVGPDLQPIIDPNEVYSGCYVRVSITFYAFNTNGNRGIACGLGNIQKLRDGEPLVGNRISAESDFGSFASADDDFLN